MRHVIDLCHEGLYRPDIATLDCGSLNFGDGNRAYVSTPNYLRQGAGICKDLGRKARTGGVRHGQSLVRQANGQGRPRSPPLPSSNCAWAFPTAFRPTWVTCSPWSIRCPRHCNLGHHSRSAACRCPGSRSRCCSAATCASASRTILYLSKGVYASNAQLVEKARTIIEAMGARVLTPAQAREKLQLR